MSVYALCVHSPLNTHNWKLLKMFALQSILRLIFFSLIFFVDITIAAAAAVVVVIFCRLHFKRS